MIQSMLNHIKNCEAVKKWGKEAERLGIEFNVHHMTNPIHTKHFFFIWTNTHTHTFLLSWADCRTPCELQMFGSVEDRSLVRIWVHWCMGTIDSVWAGLLLSSDRCGRVWIGQRWVKLGSNHFAMASCINSWFTQWHPGGPWNSTANFKHRLCIALLHGLCCMCRFHRVSWNDPWSKRS